MIKNDLEYQVTKDRVAKFEQALASLDRQATAYALPNSIVHKAQRDALAGTLDELHEELAAYEKSGLAGSHDLTEDHMLNKKINEIINRLGVVNTTHDATICAISVARTLVYVNMFAMPRDLGRQIEDIMAKAEADIKEVTTAYVAAHATDIADLARSFGDIAAREAIEAAIAIDKRSDFEWAESLREDDEQPESKI